MSIQTTLGVDMSPQLTGLYWWTVFSEELAERHQLDHEELKKFAEHSECWKTEKDGALHAFRLYTSPDDWREQDAHVSRFLERHPNFFSMVRIQPLVMEAQTKEEFDAFVRPYRAGAFPWEKSPRNSGVRLT